MEESLDANLRESGYTRKVSSVLGGEEVWVVFGKEASRSATPGPHR